MSREVRRVPADWQHPRDERTGRYVPLFEGPYEPEIEHWIKGGQAWLLGEWKSDYDSEQPDDYERTWRGYCEWVGQPPNSNEYMPDWTEDQKTHLMMYETTSEGTPISPAFETAEELARWLTDNHASTFASMTATYEQWLGMIKVGYSVASMIVQDGYMMSGVEAVTALPTKPSI